MLRVPRTKYFIDLWPERWEKNEERKGGGGEVPVHAAILPGDGVVAHDASELSLLCSQDVLSAFWEDKKLMDLSWNSSFSRVLAQMWVGVTMDSACGVWLRVCPPTPVTLYCSQSFGRMGVGVGVGMGVGMGVGSNRLTGMLPSRWSCHLAEKMWVMEWLGEHGLFC